MNKALEEVRAEEARRMRREGQAAVLKKSRWLLQQLWEYNSPARAGKFLDEWCRQTMRSRIEPMKKIARSLRRRREIFSGVVEGLNDKAKVTMRKSYGEKEPLHQPGGGSFTPRTSRR